MDFAGVVEQVGDDLREPDWIGVDEHGFVAEFHRQGVVATFDLIATRINRIGDHGANVERPTCEFQLAALDARDVEQIVRQSRHVLRLPADDVQGARCPWIHVSALSKH